MAFRLWLDWFNEPIASREGEYLAALRRNLLVFERVICVGADRPPFQHERLQWVEQAARPTYAQLFARINSRPDASRSDINVVANSDIYFDESLRALANVDLAHRALALSRWDADAWGNAAHLQWENSQDAWVFQGDVKAVGECDFHLGQWNCDNRLSILLAYYGYEVLNPSKDLTIFHLHATGVRRDHRRYHVPDGAGRVKIGSLADVTSRKPPGPATVLLTGCVTPGYSVAVSEPAIRELETLTSVLAWLRNECVAALVLADASGYAWPRAVLTPLAEEHNKQIEFVSRRLDNDGKGKGAAEAQLINECLGTSQLLLEAESFYKCTARLYVGNFDPVHWNEADQTIVNPNDSRFWKADVRRMAREMPKVCEETNEQLGRGSWIESVLTRRFQDAPSFQQAPVFVGRSASNGQVYHRYWRDDELAETRRIFSL
ncbi:MAG: hypothetical protein ACR2OZ_13985 [Verrucomicrobiales bacterium]